MDMERDIAILTVKSKNKEFRFIGKPFKHDDVDENDIVINIKAYILHMDGDDDDPRNRAINLILDMVEDNKHESS